MNYKRNIITTKLLGIAFLIASGTAAFAHGGFDHVIVIRSHCPWQRSYRKDGQRER